MLWTDKGSEFVSKHFKTAFLKGIFGKLSFRCLTL